MFQRLLARAFIINRLRAIGPYGYQRGSLRKSHQDGDYLKAFYFKAFSRCLLLSSRCSGDSSLVGFGAGFHETNIE